MIGISDFPLQMYLVGKSRGPPRVMGPGDGYWIPYSHPASHRRRSRSGGRGDTATKEQEE